MSQKDFRNLLHIIFDSYTSVPLSRVSVTNTKSDVFQLYSLQVCPRPKCFPRYSKFGTSLVLF